MKYSSEQMLGLLASVNHTGPITDSYASDWDVEVNTFHAAMEMSDKLFSKRLKDVVMQHKNKYAVPVFNEIKEQILKIINGNLVEKLDIHEMDSNDLNPFLFIIDIENFITKVETELGYNNGISKFMPRWREYVKHWFKTKEEMREKSEKLRKRNNARIQLAAEIGEKIIKNTETCADYVMENLSDKLEFLDQNPTKYTMMDMNQLYNWYARIATIEDEIKGAGLDDKNTLFPRKEMIWACLEQCEHLYAYHIQWGLVRAEIAEIYKDDPRFKGQNPYEWIGNAVKKWAEELDNEVFRLRTKAEAERKAEELASELKKLEQMADKVLAEKKREREWEEDGFRFSRSTPVADIYSGSKGYRLLIKNRNRNDMVRFFSQLEELGLTRGGLRNNKSEAGIIRALKIGEDMIYSDSLIKMVADKLRKKYLGKPLTRDVTNTLVIGKTILQLARDKVFFEMPWIEEAPHRVHDFMSVKDSRRIAGIMKDMGLIGQVKTKDKKKLFALTAEGFAMAEAVEDINLNPVSTEWASEIAQILADKISNVESFDILTEKVKNIESMVTGRAAKFLGYYVTDFA